MLIDVPRDTMIVSGFSMEGIAVPKNISKTFFRKYKVVPEIVP